MNGGADRAEAAVPGPVLALRSRIPADADGSSLLDYLLRRFRYHDRGEWLAAIDAGRLALDGRQASAAQRLRTGQQLVYHKVHREPEVARDLAVLFADDCVVVASKPAHLPMHADGPFVRHTFVHLLREHLGLSQLHLVHRLDRETSGICVAAKTATARATLERQFAAGTVRKRYLALVRGVVPGPFVVDAPIGHARHSAISLRRSAAADATDPRAARTEFAVAGRGADRTLLLCTPTTGRTHQIRVHLEHAGHPVLGDKLYGRDDAGYLAFVAHVKAGGRADDAGAGEPGRQLLHASDLEFDHPLAAERLHFRAPLPADFTAWLQGVEPTMDLR